MPEAGGFVYGGRVKVVREIDTSAFRTTDPPPQVGDIGEVVTINTLNGKVNSVGVEFAARSWVLERNDVEIMAEEYEFQEGQTVEIDSTWTYLWTGELELVPGEKVLLPKATDETRYWIGTITKTNHPRPQGIQLKFVLGMAP